MGLVYESVPLVERHCETSDLGPWSKLEPVLIHIVDIIANVVIALLDEIHFGRLVQFLEQKSLWSNQPYFEASQHRQHEIAVCELMPVPIGVLCKLFPLVTFLKGK